MQRLVFFALGSVATLALLLVTGWLAPPGGSERADAGGHYTLYAEFADAGTLKPGARVALAGVTVGEVADVQLNARGYRAKVRMRIDQSLDHLAIDSVAIIMTAGLVGEQYIEISPGGHPETLSDNDYIEDTQSAMSIETLIRRRIVRPR
ncbi:outer membrane lipid asymmetry maintenance protein MlaD [Halovibrio salipaludis]|uniref:Outer membrane lipid asymmetry maintenance protein MlaD n=1 Tax=Halovibrio salipaludis TaxID=2032626 RepID=A0A2A2F222_9GAMM|nr:outer membrane lipid asymmetry maintenance protein MlaD [Halovibrio salipaludis]PAU78707.1 outer membrane lipid asymmetry maintenance protein MlaD [Halovibrio salipaludis]